LLAVRHGEGFGSCSIQVRRRKRLPHVPTSRRDRDIRRSRRSGHIRWSKKTWPSSWSCRARRTLPLETEGAFHTASARVLAVHLPATSRGAPPDASDPGRSRSGARGGYGSPGGPENSPIRSTRSKSGSIRTWRNSARAAEGITQKLEEPPGEEGSASGVPVPVPSPVRRLRTGAPGP
jgi:hypothetical protein